MEFTDFIKNPTLESLDSLKRKDFYKIIKELKIVHRATSPTQIFKEQIIFYYINKGVFDKKYLSLVTPEVDGSQAENLLKQREIEFKEWEIEKDRQLQIELKEMELQYKLKMEQLEEEYASFMSCPIPKSTTPVSERSAFYTDSYCRSVPTLNDQSSNNTSNTITIINTKSLQAASPVNPGNSNQNKSISPLKNLLSLKNDSGVVKTKSIVSCKYCMKFGHTIDQCRNCPIRHSKDFKPIGHIKPKELFDHYNFIQSDETTSHQNIKDLRLVAEMADTYNPVHRCSSYVTASHQNQSHNSNTITNTSLHAATPVNTGISPQNKSLSPRKNYLNQSLNQEDSFAKTRSNVFCNYCKKPGHSITQCRKCPSRPSQDFKDSKPICNVKATGHSGHSLQSDKITSLCNLTKFKSNELLSSMSMEEIQPQVKTQSHDCIQSSASNTSSLFTTDAERFNANKPSTSTKTTVSRDTGFSPLMDNVFAVSDPTDTGGPILKQEVGSVKTLELPHEPQSALNLFNAEMTLNMVPEPPVKDFQLLRNDLDGDQEFPQVIIQPSLLSIDSSKDQSDLGPDCLITIDMNKEQNHSVSSHTDGPSDTSLLNSLQFLSCMSQADFCPTQPDPEIPNIVTKLNSVDCGDETFSDCCLQEDLLFGWCTALICFLLVAKTEPVYNTFNPFSEPFKELNIHAILKLNIHNDCFNCSINIHIDLC